MDLKQWSETVLRYPFMKRVFIAILLLCGWTGMRYTNQFVYGTDRIDPTLNYAALIIIVIWGYARWAVTLAAAFPGTQILEWIWKCIAHLVVHRKIDDAATTKITKSVFTEERSIKAIRSIRNGTKAFRRTGIWIGFIAWTANYFFVNPTPGLQGASTLALVYIAWGYGWYKLGRYGWLPLPNPESQAA